MSARLAISFLGFYIYAWQTTDPECPMQHESGDTGDTGSKISFSLQLSQRVMQMRCQDW